MPPSSQTVCAYAGVHHTHKLNCTNTYVVVLCVWVVLCIGFDYALCVVYREKKKSCNLDTESLLVVFKMIQWPLPWLDMLSLMHNTCICVMYFEFALILIDSYVILKYFILWVICNKISIWLNLIKCLGK